MVLIRLDSTYPNSPRLYHAYGQQASAFCRILSPQFPVILADESIDSMVDMYIYGIISLVPGLIQPLIFRVFRIFLTTKHTKYTKEKLK